MLPARTDLVLDWGVGETGIVEVEARESLRTAAGLALVAGFGDDGDGGYVDEFER